MASPYARPNRSAGAGVAARGPVRPTLPGGEPSYYLPGSNVPDPRYAQRKQAWDVGQQATHALNTRHDTERNNFILNANNGVPFAMSYTDPRTGMSYNYPTSGGGSSSGRAGGELEDFDFDAALGKARRAGMGPLRPAQPVARVVGATPADAAAAEAAQFARAKDRIGAVGRGNLSTLQEQFSSRGLGGSRMEAGATGELLGDVQGELGEVIRDQAIQNLVRQRQVEDRNYAGDLTQRGQDVGFETTTRGQDSQHEQARAASLVPFMQLIAANRRRRLY